MDMQVVVDFLLDEIANILVDAHPARGHRQRAQLDLRLTLKDRFFHIDGYRSHDTSTNVAVLIFPEIVTDGSSDMLLEGTLMGTTLRGVLTINKGIVLLAILIGMGKGNLDILTLQMDDGVKRLVGHTVFQQILQSMTGEDTSTIIHDGQSDIQIGIVAEHILHYLIMKLVVLEEFGIVVGLEEDVCAVLVLRVLRHIAGYNAFLESGPSDFAVTVAPYLKVRTQRINSFHTNTIQTYGFLEGL